MFMQRSQHVVCSIMAKRKKRQRLSDKAIREIVAQVRKLRTRKLSPKMRKVVKRNASKLRIMSDPKVSLKRKRKLLVQKGGFLGRALGSALGAATSSLFPTSASNPMAGLATNFAKYALPMMRNLHKR